MRIYFGLKGSTNINDDLTQHTPIWDPWANDKGELGPIYGYQWRKWENLWKTANTKVFIIKLMLIKSKLHGSDKNHPESRRIIVSGWNVSDIDRMALPPCHTLFQVLVAGGRLDLQLYQRSADIALECRITLRVIQCC